MAKIFGRGLLARPGSGSEFFRLGTSRDRTSLETRAGFCKTSTFNIDAITGTGGDGNGIVSVQK